MGQWLGHVLNRSNRGMNRRAVAHLDVRSGQRVLDVGFGGGVGLMSILEVSEAVSLAGLDVSHTMVEQQRARFAQRIAQGQVDLAHGDVTAMPFTDGGFDRVLSSNTIYFWPEPVAALGEILRVLRPGGRLVLACATKRTLERFPPARHGFARYDQKDVRGLLTQAGFVGLEVAHAPDEPHYFAIAHRPPPA